MTKKTFFYPPWTRAFARVTTLFFTLFAFTFAYADFQDTLPVPEIIKGSDVPTPAIAKPAKKRHASSVKQEAPSDSTGDMTKHNSNAPVYFQGKSADGSRKTGIYNLIGSVVITQDDTKLTSDNAKIISAPGTSVALTGPSSVQKAIATGNVHVFKKGPLQELKAEADKIEFLVPEGIMILTGNAKVWKGQELINASTMVLNIKNGDIKLQDPHGTIDPHSTSQFSQNTSSSTSEKK